MKKQIITSILGLALMIGIISLVSAETHYVGDTFEIPTDFEIVNCSVTNSTYGIDGLDLNWSGKNIIISTSPYSYPDNFSISCWVIKGRDVVEKHYSSGGGSCYYDTNYDWECGSWGSCVNGEQTRTCKEYNNCHSTYGKPNETQSCVDGVIDEINQTDLNQTGDVILDEPEKVGFWRRFWEWLKGLVGK